MDDEDFFDRAFYGMQAAPDDTKRKALVRLAAPRLITRRSLLTAGVAGAAGLAAAGPAQAVSALMCPPVVGEFGGGNASNGSAYDDDGVYDYSGEVPDDGPGLRVLHMTCHGTGETFNRAYVENGQYVPEALEEFTRFARSKYDGSTRPMDPKVIDIVYKVWKKLGGGAPCNLNSGYRSPAHNASLSGKGAAKNSYHMQAKACDIVMPGKTVNQMYQAARAVNGGGVGKYTSSGFVHVDSGPIRTWGS